MAGRYTFSKAAVTSLSETLGPESAPLGTGDVTASLDRVQLHFSPNGAELVFRIRLCTLMESNITKLAHPGMDQYMKRWTTWRLVLLKTY